MPKCDSLDCAHNDKIGFCRQKIVIEKGRCVSCVTDMDYLQDKWKYIKGREQVISNRPEYSPDMIKEDD